MIFDYLCKDGIEGIGIGKTLAFNAQNQLTAIYYYGDRVIGTLLSRVRQVGISTPERGNEENKAWKPFSGHQS
jgi:hypothetical protein